MRSLIDITFGKVEPSGWGVHVPIGVHVSEDASDDLEVPVIEFTWFKFWITHANIQKGMDVVLKNAEDALEEQFRFFYGAITYPRLKDAVLTHLASTDLTQYATQWFADPASPTRH